MRKGKFRLGEREKEIIKMAGLGVLILSVFALPGLPQALKIFLRGRGPKEFQKKIRKLEDKGVIYLSGEEVKLTKRGQKLLLEIEVSDIEVPLPKKWDGTWHLVSYDIPDPFKKERDWFRFTLKRLGFKKVQKSLWVLPYECKEEIAVIAQNLRIAPFVIVMATDRLPNQKKLENYFNLQK